MIPPRAHVGLYKALISIWVIGMCGTQVLRYLLSLARSVVNNLGPVEGTTGGIFDAVGVGIRETVSGGALEQAKPVLSIVAIAAIVVFMRSPVPKVLRPIFSEKST